MTKQIFKAGDKVSWCGTEGIVTNRNDSAPQFYRLSVEFDSGSKNSFSEKGFYLEGHKEPSLELISRLEEIEEVEVEYWRYKESYEICCRPKSNPFSGGNWKKIKPIFK